jgi:hypothetical protein
LNNNLAGCDKSAERRPSITRDVPDGGFPAELNPPQGARAEGRLLGFDTGDWSMLLGGFFLAGLLALMV